MHVIMHVSMHLIGLSQLAKTNRPCTTRAGIELKIENEIMNLNVLFLMTYYLWHKVTNMR